MENAVMGLEQNWRLVVGEGYKSSNGAEFFLSFLLQILSIFCERFGSSSLPKCVDLFPVALCFLLSCVRTSSCAQQELGWCRNCELIYLLDKIRERGRMNERKKGGWYKWWSVFVHIWIFFSVVFNILQMQSLKKKKKNAERDRLLWRAGKLW